MKPSKVSQRAADAIAAHLVSGGNPGMIAHIIEQEVAPLLNALQQFATCNLNESNCANLTVATNRVRTLAHLAIKDAR